VILLLSVGVITHVINSHHGSGEVFVRKTMNVYRQNSKIWSLLLKPLNRPSLTFAQVITSGCLPRYKMSSIRFRARMCPLGFR